MAVGCDPACAPKRRLPIFSGPQASTKIRSWLWSLEKSKMEPGKTNGIIVVGWNMLNHVSCQLAVFRVISLRYLHVMIEAFLVNGIEYWSASGSSTAEPSDDQEVQLRLARRALNPCNNMRARWEALNQQFQFEIFKQQLPVLFSSPVLQQVLFSRRRWPSFVSRLAAFSAEALVAMGWSNCSVALKANSGPKSPVKPGHEGQAFWSGEG